MWMQSISFSGWRRPLAIVTAVVAACGIIASTSPASAQGAALDFDGVDDLVVIANPSGFGSTSTLTVEAWVRPSAVDGINNVGIVRGWNFVLYQTWSDNTRWALSIAIGPTDAAQSPTGSLSEGRWDHLAGTYDGTTMRIYQNGGLVGEQVHPVGGNMNISGQVTIGFWPSAFGFNGTIDEVRIWNVARTPAEIQQFMRQSLNGAEAGLIGYWRLDEGSGQVVNGSSSESNDGTLGFLMSGEAEDPQWTTDYTEVFIDGFEFGNTNAWSLVVP